MSDENQTTSRRIDVIEGRAIPLRGHDIDTDRIIPARYLKAVTFDGLERGLFEDDRAQLEARGAVHPFSDERFAAASVLIVNRNFGCGSSREHAPQALQRWGIRAVLGESYSEIFFGNSVSLGLPCLTLPGAAIAALHTWAEEQPAGTLRVSVSALEVLADGKTWTATMPASAREALTQGTWDATGLLLDAPQDIQAVAGRLPYLTAFGG